MECLLLVLSTMREIHSAPAPGIMSSDSDKEAEEEEGIEEEDEDNFNHLSSGSSTGEENGNLFTLTNPYSNIGLVLVLFASQNGSAWL